ncbi:MAG TPA: hypothetical protein VGE74_30185 [Gemmata sp.]
MYPDRIAILPRVLAAPDAPGEEVPSWPDPDPAQEHWARIEAPSGSETGDPPAGSSQSMVLRFRHVVTVAAVDHVRLKDTGDEFAVLGVWRERVTDGGRGFQTVALIG